MHKNIIKEQTIHVSAFNFEGSSVGSHTVKVRVCGLYMDALYPNIIMRQASEFFRCREAFISCAIFRTLNNSFFAMAVGGFILTSSATLLGPVMAYHRDINNLACRVGVCVIFP